ncbi:biotin/lipoyl-binding protein [bacterium]|nr:biotin/lipoyl-binding protein [bacterium]
MLIRLGLPIASGIGIVIAICAIILGAQKAPLRPILFPPSVSPYEHTIAGSGVVEASTNNIYIGTPFNEIVWEVFVKVGDTLKKGDPVFQLDSRTYEAQLVEAIAAKQRAQVELENAITELSLYDALKDKRAVSLNTYNQVFFKKQTALAQIEVQEARIKTAQTFIDRSFIRAPCDGKILQRNIFKGEAANLFVNESLIIFGPVCPYHLRVNIDEDDAWRFRPDTPAKAFVRGNSSLSFPLKWVRTEPMMIPKKNLTGDNAERVDSRVLVVIYEFDCSNPSVYAGQVMDVYIESIPANTRYTNGKN